MDVTFSPLFSEDYLKRRHVSPRLFWAGCFLIAVSGNLVARHVPDRPMRHIFLCVVLDFAGLILVPAALHSCHRLFMAWASAVDLFVLDGRRADLNRWKSDFASFFGGSAGMLGAGLLFAALALCAYESSDYLDNSNALIGGWEAVQVVVAAGMAGCGLWVMWQGARAVWVLGTKFKDDIVVAPDSIGVLSTGRMLAQCWARIGGVWLFYTCSACLGPPFDNVPATLKTWPILLLAFPTLPLIVGLFIGSQVPLHEAMLRFKDREIRRLRAMLSAVEVRNVEGLTQDALKLERSVRRRINEVDTLPEWPFRGPVMLSVAKAVLAAVSPLLLKVLATYASAHHIHGLEDILEAAEAFTA